MQLDGEVVYDNRWLRRDLRRLRLEKIGFIFQTHNLLPFLNATDNVAVVHYLAGLRREESIKRAVELLNYLQVGHRKHAMPAQLSGGEAQRVAIARALANRPRIILADEPTAALDSVRAGIVMDLLRTLAVEQQAAVIAVTHDEKIFDRFDSEPFVVGRTSAFMPWAMGVCESTSTCRVKFCISTRCCLRASRLTLLQSVCGSASSFWMAS